MFSTDSLKELDPEIEALIQREKWRQYSNLELIASENFTSAAVMEANGSALTNKYSEGLPGARYYGGNEYIDVIEVICQKRALNAFHVSDAEWGVNVQPYSGSTANFAVFTGILKPHDRIMGLDLPSGGHLTHGYQTAKKKISSSAIYFESMSYQVNPETGLVDYELLRKNALLFRPKLIICGASAYPRDWEYSILRSIAEECGAYLMADIAHYSGLVASKLLNNPFEYCDVVNTTTHKTLRGPRAGLTFYKLHLKNQIDFAVFPSCQGGPHNNTIAAIATALLQVATPEFVQYSKNIVENSRTVAETLSKMGYTLATGGTDTHLVLWDLRKEGVTGSKMEKICDLVGITLNKNSVPGDTSAFTPGGVRVGSAALTSRGFTPKDFVIVAEFLSKALDLAKSLQEHAPKLIDFVKACERDDRVKDLKKEVHSFARGFPMFGFDKDSVPEEFRE